MRRLPKPDEFADLSMSVRMFCAGELEAVVCALRPYVDGSFGEILPGHVAAFTSVVKELGRLFQANRPPAVGDGWVAADRVAVLVEEARVLAVEEALVLERERQAGGGRLALDAARGEVEASLAVVAGRG